MSKNSHDVEVMSLMLSELPNNNRSPQGDLQGLSLTNVGMSWAVRWLMKRWYQVALWDTEDPVSSGLDPEYRLKIKIPLSFSLSLRFCCTHSDHLFFKSVEVQY